MLEPGCCRPPAGDSPDGSRGRFSNVQVAALVKGEGIGEGHCLRPGKSLEHAVSVQPVDTAGSRITGGVAYVQVADGINSQPERSGVWKLETFLRPRLKRTN